MTTSTPQDDPGRSDESRDISDVGLPGPGDAEPGAAVEEQRVDEAALDEVFPPAG